VGLLLLLWLREARRVGRRAAALRGHAQQLADAEQQLGAAGQALERARAALVRVAARSSSAPGQAGGCGMQ
jgi:hypothetical protein